MAKRERVDVFQNVKPYYGTSMLYEQRDNVPTLYTLCVRCVIDSELDFEGVPTVIHSKLIQYKLYQDYRGPKILICSKFYSKHKKFIKHKCN